MSEHDVTSVSPIFIGGAPSWASAVAQALAGSMSVEQVTDFGQYMSALIVYQPGLILLGDERDDWRRWVTTPKVSPATRRIPVVLVTDTVAHAEHAPVLGADAVISRAGLSGAERQVVARYGRMRDHTRREQLACECAEPLPALASEGIARFNAGEYYRQHDLLEALWMETAGPVRDLYRAILQVGVAYYQIERGNLRGALKMLQRSVQWLAVLPDACQGVDVRQLREDSERVRAELERLGPSGDVADFDRTLLRGVQTLDHVG